MAVSIKTSVVMKNNNTKAVVSRISGLTTKKMGIFAQEIAQKARDYAHRQNFKDSTGELASKIAARRVGLKTFRIASSSGYLSYIELGTQYIKGKQPVLWPAYRFSKRRFLSQGKWL